MNVLSLFDGISCGRLALERAGVKVSTYHASEIDASAITISSNNWPGVVQLGDVTDWRTWELPKIDLLLAGSPCQGFSFNGKRLALDDPRSRLFWEFVDVLDRVKPKWFLLENVRMEAKHAAVISKALGVEPRIINSSVLSAQHRIRYYWTNIPFKTPDDAGIRLSSVLDDPIECAGALAKLDKGNGYTCRYAPDATTARFLKKAEGSTSRWRAWNRICETRGKANTLLTAGQSLANTGATNIAYNTPDGVGLRPLSITEAERLQTLPEGYTEGVPITYRHQALGNGWTVDVVSHIFASLKP
jgi:site-specific DNA-cytosine methylase